MIKIMKKMKILSIFIILFVVSFSFVGAQADPKVPGDPQTLNISIPNPLKGGSKTLPELITLIIDEIVFPLGSALIVLSIIYSGFQFIKNSDNPSEVTKQKTSFKYIILGSAILLGAKGISLAIQSTFSKLVNF